MHCESDAKEDLDGAGKTASGRDTHTPCHGKVATAAAIYPFQLCRAILEGLAEEMKIRKRWNHSANLVMPDGHGEEEEELHDRAALENVMVASQAVLR